MLCVLVAVLSGCAQDEPAPSRTEPDGTVIVSVGDSAESAVVARLYVGMLASVGTDTRLDETQRDRQRYLSDLDAGAITVVPETMSDLLSYLEPFRTIHREASISDGTEADPDEVFAQMSRALPIGLSVADYADAQPPDAGPDYPNNIVPLFRTGELGSRQITALNVVAGELTSEDLVDMTDRIDAGEPPADVVDGWLESRQS